MFLRSCSWHESVIVLTANRWQREVLAADSVYHKDGIILCNLFAAPVMSHHATFINYVVTS